MITILNSLLFYNNNALPLQLRKDYYNQLSIKYKLKIQNIINSLLIYDSYDTRSLNTQQYINFLSYFNNILFYKKHTITIKDLNNYDINLKDCKDIRFLIETLIFLIKYSSINNDNINYYSKYYINDNLQHKQITKPQSNTSISYQLKKHSYFDNNLNILIIFQCYVISSINIILQNSIFEKELVNTNIDSPANPLQLSGDNEKIIEAFQSILLQPNNNSLKVIKAELNKSTKNKYLFGLSPIKIYPHILVNDLLKILSSIKFTDDCKIIYDNDYNSVYSFILNLEKNNTFINDFKANQELPIITSYNLYDEIINDVNIYKIYGISNDCFNEDRDKMIKKYHGLKNTFQRNITLKINSQSNNQSNKSNNQSSSYHLDKLIVFNSINNHFCMYRTKNNKIYRYDNDVDKRNMRSTKLNKDDKYLILVDNDNVYDCVGFYKIVMVMYERIENRE